MKSFFTYALVDVEAYEIFPVFGALDNASAMSAAQNHGRERRHSMLSVSAGSLQNCSDTTLYLMNTRLLHDRTTARAQRACQHTSDATNAQEHADTHDAHARRVPARQPHSPNVSFIESRYMYSPASEDPIRGQPAAVAS